VRFQHPDGEVIHLAYCSNVHPAEDLDGILAQLRTFALPVRTSLEVDRLGIGLWLPAPVLAELGEPAALRRLSDGLARAGVEVVTLNGFPYGGFHAPVVKHAVYRPDWATTQRLDYTLGLARVLARLLPDDVAEGSISTLPLGWRDGWTERADEARANLERLAEGLRAVAGETGRCIRVGLEPEPGCTVETSAQLAEAIAGVAPDVLGACLDACHLAVQFEDPAKAVQRVHDGGLSVVKAQLSSALRASDPQAARAELAAFVEPRFLHQTRERTDELDGQPPVIGVDDLDEALDGGLPGAGEWHVHFHVPVHVAAPTTTQDHLRRAITALVAAPATRHLEVETYTWGVLPPAERPVDDAGLVEGLAKELRWTRERLLAAGLEEIT
jgi:sugar phosphate isomerase/epimerase